MKKISGKALSLVLSLALVVSSFSASLASASTKTVSGSVDLKQDDAKSIYLVSGGKDSGVNLTQWIDNQQASGEQVSMDTPDHQTVTVDQILDVSHISGDRLVKWGNATGSKISDDDNDDAYLFLKSNTVEGKEVIAVLYKGTYSDEDGNDITVKAKENITVNVSKEGTVFVGKYYGTGIGDRTGKSIEDISTLSQKTDTVGTIPGSSTQYVDSAEVGVYAIFDDVDGDNSCLANYKPVDASFEGAGTTTVAPNAAYFTVKASGSVASKCTFVGDTTNKNHLTVYANDGVGTGTITFTATHTNSGTGANKSVNDFSLDTRVTANKVADDKVTAKETIAKRVTVYAQTGVTKDKKTYIATNMAGKNSEGEIDVSGYDIKIADGVSSFSIGDKCSVGDITGGKGLTTLSVDTATVGDITLDDDAATDVTLNDSKVGTVNAKKGSVAITGGNTSSVAGADNGVSVYSGTVGDITSAGGVDIEATDDDTTTSVGVVKADGTTTVDNMDSKVVVKGYTAKSDTSILQLAGDSVSVGSIDMDYRAATLSLDDFQGKLPSPVNAKNASIETTDEDDNATFTGVATIDSLDLQDESAVSFDNTLKVSEISGSGSLKLPLSDLYVVDGVSGSPILKFSNDFKVGDTAFKADSDAVDIEDFTPFGFTLSKSEGSSTDTFKIATVAFAGLTINPSSSEVVLGTANAKTFTASAYPTGTSIPTGDKIAFDFDGNDNVFKVTDNGNGTATVEVISVDSSFASENEGTLTAKLVDENGDDDTDYDSTDATITAVTTPSVTFKSDTTGDVKMNVGGTYQFKITSLDGSVPAFGLGSTIAAVTSTSKSGNDYFYKVTAKQAGDVGVYVNNTRVAILRISGASAKIDTTTVKIKVGSTYQFKVTSATKPAFGLGSSALQTVATSNQGQDYFYKVKAVSGKTGDQIGVYVNGARAAVVTIG